MTDAENFKYKFKLILDDTFIGFWTSRPFMQSLSLFYTTVLLNSQFRFILMFCIWWYIIISIGTCMCHHLSCCHLLKFSMRRCFFSIFWNESPVSLLFWHGKAFTLFFFLFFSLFVIWLAVIIIFFWSYKLKEKKPEIGWWRNDF